jgi:ribosomal protein S18 acetylase RimI-like enzyme
MLSALIQISADIRRISDFLTRTSNYFTPPLATRVDLQAYSSKLAEKAINIFLNDDGIDIAHGAFYPPDKPQGEAFLTSFCVDKPWWGKQQGDRLIQEISQACVNRGAGSIRLEVANINEQAVCFYARQGFEYTTAHTEISTMIKRLSGTHSAEHD